MKPLHVGILMAVAALGGGLLMKWQSSRTAIPAQPAAAVAFAPTANPAPDTTQIAKSPAQPPQDVLPSPFPEKQERTQAAEPPRRVRTHRVAEHTRVIAQNQTPTLPPPQAQVIPAPAPAQPAPVTPPVRSEPEQAAPPAPLPPPPPRSVTLQAGSLIPARTVETLSSNRNAVGDTFTATLDQPLVVDGIVIAERGARLEGKIVQSQRAGRLKGVSDLAIALTQVTTSDGQRVMIETDSFEKHGDSSTKENVAKIGGGAALGAIIGAIAGGGKGAAIGTAVGGAAGTAGAAATRGKTVTLPGETRINFRLRNP
ncbi:MAG: hypothetical protein JWO48_2338, partial [Bryobacterales bacterium]|nr:hypothetical protein [Bryobacterales bacterium]